jgi:predicted dehydrogenase
MIEVAVVGAGHWGPNLIRNFDNHTRSRVRWIVDTDRERLRAAQARFAGATCATDVAQALADPRVQAVVIATPTVTHAALTRAALESGRHVLVEKPLTTEATSARALSELAGRSGLVLLVGHVFVHNPAVQWVKQRLLGGELGRLYYASSSRTNLGPIRTDVNVAWDLAAQDIAIFDYWLGTTPESVSAQGHGWLNGGRHEDAVFATLRYPGEVLVHLHVSWLNPRKVRHITLVADQRMLTYDDSSADEPIRIYDKRALPLSPAPLFVDTYAAFRAQVHSGDITIPPVRMGEPLQLECMHFLDCIEHGKKPLTGGPQAVAVVETLEAIDRSLAARGREEPVR